MNITINIKTEDIPLTTLIKTIKVDELVTILGISNLQLQYQNISANIGQDAEMQLEYIQKNPDKN